MRAALPAALLLAAACGDTTAPDRLPHLDRSRAELRPTDTSSSEMWRYQASDVVEQFDTDGGFRVHFTRAGTNRVPAGDANDSGVPDFVEAVGGVYDAVAAKYQGSLGFRAPLGDATATSNGGDGRFDVYLLDFARSADGAFRVDGCSTANPEQCFGYVVQENDFAGYGYPSATAATRILGSHEYFHAVQAAYDDNQGVVLSEGTAVWATEQFDPSTNDLEGFVHGYLERTDRSLDSPPPGPVPTFAYGSAVFFQFLSERYDPALVRTLLERCVNGQGHPSEPGDVADPHWMVQLDALLKAEHQSSFAQAFLEFSTWNLWLGPAADAAVSYDNGAAYPLPTMTIVPVPYQVLPLRVFYASAQYFRLSTGGRPAMTAALVDDPASAEDDTRDLALVLAPKRANRNEAVKVLSDARAGTETVDSPNAQELVVAVVNTARQGSGGVLSRRPGLCIGTPAEVLACRKALDPSVDAGQPDAGSTPDAGQPEPDAGTLDGGTGLPPSPQGCGCGAGAPGLWSAALLVLAPLFRRRRAGRRATSPGPCAPRRAA